MSTPATANSSPCRRLDAAGNIAFPWLVLSIALHDKWGAWKSRLAGLLALALTGVVVFQSLRWAMPMQCLENGLLKRRKAEARANPIEYLQNEVLRRAERLARSFTWMRTPSSTSIIGMTLLLRGWRLRSRSEQKAAVRMQIRGRCAHTRREATMPDRVDNFMSSCRACAAAFSVQPCEASRPLRSPTRRAFPWPA